MGFGGKQSGDSERVRQSAAQAVRVEELSGEKPDALVEEATTGAYGDDEQLAGFAVMIEDNLEVPFETTVLGVPVTVSGITRTDSGTVADRVRDSHHQAIAVLDLPLPSRRRRVPSGSPPAGTGQGLMSKYDKWGFPR